MTQTVTPELRQWIVDQSMAGCMPEDVLAAMVKAGWNADLAETAMEQTLREHLRQIGGGRVAAPAPAEAPSREVVPVPDISLVESPRRLDAGDRWVDVIASLSRPRVVVLGGGLGNIELLYSEGVAAARPFVFNNSLKTKFLKPALGDSAGVFGAALLSAG